MDKEKMYREIKDGLNEMIDGRIGELLEWTDEENDEYDDDEKHDLRMILQEEFYTKKYVNKYINEYFDIFEKAENEDEYDMMNFELSLNYKI